VEPLGPSAVDANLQAIVVSDETSFATAMANEVRAAAGMRPLETLAVGLVAAAGGAAGGAVGRAAGHVAGLAVRSMSKAELTAAKVSSTTERPALSPEPPAFPPTLPTLPTLPPEPPPQPPPFTPNPPR
jgi:hypothetical protein